MVSIFHTLQSLHIQSQKRYFTFTSYFFTSGSWVFIISFSWYLNRILKYNVSLIGSIHDQLILISFFTVPLPSQINISTIFINVRAVITWRNFVYFLIHSVSLTKMSMYTQHFRNNRDSELGNVFFSYSWSSRTTSRTTHPALIIFFSRVCSRWQTNDCAWRRAKRK